MGCHDACVADERRQMEVASGPSDERKQSVLVVHNRYRSLGGEDVVFEAEASLLEEHGHRVRRLSVDNSRLPAVPQPAQRARLALETIWSSKAATAVRRAVRDFRPDIVHVHNTFPQLSPSIYEACRSEGVSVVQTLHNFRLICPVATLLRDGKPCEDCVGRVVPWPSVLHACYDDSRSKTATIAAMLSFNRVRKSFNHVAAYIALSNFNRTLFIKGGLPAERVLVKRNFLAPDPGARTGAGSDFVYVGRLSTEKGISTLLSAWKLMDDHSRLRVVGDGPLRPSVEEAARTTRSISYEGPLSRSGVISVIGTARALIVPSVWYECSPLTVIEAFACGVPVIASRIGALLEMVQTDKNGLTFTAGDPRDLASSMKRMQELGPAADEMGKTARADYESLYTGDRNYRRLVEIYRTATGL